MDASDWFTSFSLLIATHDIFILFFKSFLLYFCAVTSSSPYTLSAQQSPHCCPRIRDIIASGKGFSLGFIVL